jgi:hypothetical protein
MTVLAKLQERLAYIDSLILETTNPGQLDYLTEARAALKNAINEPGDITIDGDVTVDLSTVSNEIEAASNLANVSSLLTDIEAAVDTLETLVNFTKSTGNADSNTIRVVLALNDLLFSLLGQTGDAASETGSINAKLRQFINRLDDVHSSLGIVTTNTNDILNLTSSIEGKLGSSSEAASSTGSIHAKLRQIANLLTPEVPLIYTSLGSAVTANIKNTSTKLYSLACTNLATTTRYLLLFNSTGSTATPVASYPIYGNGGFTLLDNNFFKPYKEFSTGLTFGFSVQPTTYVAGAAADCLLEVRYL